MMQRLLLLLALCCVVLLVQVQARNPYRAAEGDYCEESLIQVNPPESLVVTGATNLASENFCFFTFGGQDLFLVGSAFANVYQSNCSGATTKWTNVTASKITTGVKINPYDGLLYVLFTNFPPIYNNPNQSFIGVFAPESGEQLAFINLTPYGNSSAGVLANDLTFKPGRVYISDSLSNVIYVFHTRSSKIYVYSSSPLYVGTPSPLVGGLPIGLEGLFIPQGANYMVVSKFTDGSGANPAAILVKVPHATPNNPALVTVTNLNNTLAGGLDGLYYDYTNCNLYGANFQGNVYRIYSTDQWTTAVIDAIAPVPAVLNKPPLGPTVSVLRTPNGDFYALNAGGFNPQGVGTIQKVTWDTPAINRCSYK